MTSGTIPTRRGFWPGWVLANTLGYAVAFAAWVMLSQPLWPALAGWLGGSATLALFGAVLGLGASEAQALALRWPLGRAARWIAAATLAGALGMVVGAWLSLWTMQAFPPVSNKYLTNICANFAFGLPLGASLGAARWLVTRGDRRARRWIPASMVAFTVAYGTAVGNSQIAPPLPLLVLSAGFGAWVGAIAALIEWAWLRRRTFKPAPAAGDSGRASLQSRP
jgi:hypothetical protein